MTASIIDGKAHAAALKVRLAAATARLKAEHGLVPGLATVLVGDDPASEVYVRNKNKTAEALGFKSVHHHLAATASEAEVLALVARLNADRSVHGILVQLPLPGQIREQAVLDTLDPAKDVDALTPANAGLLLAGRAKLVSCTPMGVMILLQETIGSVAGLEALVIGRSLLFGKPAAQLLLAAKRSCAAGLPNKSERPITSASKPATAPSVSLSRIIIPDGVHDTSLARPDSKSPALVGVRASTSLTGSSVSSTACSRICPGKGICTRIPWTAGSALRVFTSASTSASLAATSRW